MTFTDLPDDWPSRPLTEPVFVADVLDLLLGESDRRTGTLLVAVCDSGARLVQPLAITDLDDRGRQGPRHDDLGPLFTRLARQFPGALVLVALGRPGGLTLKASDHAWRRAVDAASLGTLRVLGFHVVTTHGSREVPAAHAA